MVNIGASVICMDPLNLERDCREAVRVGVNFLHLDIMDGHAVPRYGLYPEILTRIKRLNLGVPLDVHLMVTDPGHARAQFDLEGCHVSSHWWEPWSWVDGIVVHLGEAVFKEPKTMVTLMGCRPGDLRKLYRDPIDELVQKIHEAISMYDIVQVDGGVRWDTVGPLAQAGATHLVCGSAMLYSSPDLEGNYARIRSLLDV